MRESLALVLAVVALAAPPLALADAPARQRLIVLTDIEADPDDTQSLVRLLLYSNEIDVALDRGVGWPVIVVPAG